MYTTQNNIIDVSELIGCIANEIEHVRPLKKNREISEENSEFQTRHRAEIELEERKGDSGEIKPEKEFNFEKKEQACEVVSKTAEPFRRQDSNKSTQANNSIRKLSGNDSFDTPLPQEMSENIDFLGENILEEAKGVAAAALEDVKLPKKELHDVCYLRTKADGMKEYIIEMDDENIVLSRQSKRGMSELTYALNSL